MQESTNQPSLTMPEGPPHVRVELLSQPRYLSGARDLVSAIARRFGFDEAQCGQIALAVDEALCNIIRHGYARRTDGHIWLQLWPTTTQTPQQSNNTDQTTETDGIFIVLDDEAEQVELDAIQGRDLDDIRPGGLGVFLIRSVMDDVTYQHRPTGGMRLMMRKRTTTSSSNDQLPPDITATHPPTDHATEQQARPTTDRDETEENA